MSRRLTPDGLCPPFARYAHAVEVEAGARLLFVSGQLGVLPDGSVASGAEAQAAQCFVNIAAILTAAGMGPADLVRLNAYVTDRAHLAAYMRARDAFIAGLAEPPASTLMIVAGFARPELLVEVEAVAARREVQS
jgi:enamine deaminase RidA (YjgF/YER057c/UK114 family)